MQLTVLGSGVLIPVARRGNSGYLLQVADETILIDGGSGALRRVADLGLDYRHIETVCYTHLHPDHVFDLVPLLFAWKHDPQVTWPRTLTILAPRGFRDYYTRLMELYGQWVLHDQMTITIHELFRDQFSVGAVTITTIHTAHTDHSLGFRFTDRDGHSLFYSGDTDFSEEVINGARNVDVLLLECSYPDKDRKEGHLTPTACGRLAAQAHCKRLILTHFYPAVLSQDIPTLVRAHFTGQTDLAYDGMQIQIGE
jgi:ribonuclease BN (tRNA processing enzyme)